MRDDTTAAISRLPDEQQRSAQKQVPSFEELESRLSPERRVVAAFQTVCRPADGESYEMDLGALLISSYGFHWLGGRSGRLDLPWEQVVRHDVITVPLSMIRKSKRAFRLEVTSPPYDLQFALSDESMAAFVRAALAEAQPLL
jgi:hypothetical protein